MTDVDEYQARRAERAREQLCWDVAAELWGAAFKAHALNEYGAIVDPGYKVEDSAWPNAARVTHKLPETDLRDPDRLSSDERWALRLEMLERYTTVLRERGWVVEPSGVRPGTYEPWLIVRRGAEGASRG